MAWGVKEGRIPDACGLIGILNKDRKRISGEYAIRAVCNMKERGNRLGAGYAGYGIYPEMADFYALHVMMESPDVKEVVDKVIKSSLKVVKSEEIPMKPIIKRHPYFWRYFVEPRQEKIKDETDDDVVMRAVMSINDEVEGAFVISSGKNMGAFKGVGNPDEIGEFFQIKYYDGWTWLGHTRFPTNTPGWWGGAHPFTLLDWSVIHNGEISSYGTNKNFLEMFGYKLRLLTDTEVAAYAIDFLVRKQKLPLRVAFTALASPFWKDVDILSEDGAKDFAEAVKAIRVVYGPLMLNGPFAIIVAWAGGMAGINDRIKLRPLFAGARGKTLYISSEEAAIREICSDSEKLWMPRAGEPVIGYLEDGSV